MFKRKKNPLDADDTPLKIYSLKESSQIHLSASILNPNFKGSPNTVPKIPHSGIIQLLISQAYMDCIKIELTESYLGDCIDSIKPFCKSTLHYRLSGWRQIRQFEEGISVSLCKICYTIQRSFDHDAVLWIKFPTRIQLPLTTPITFSGFRVASRTQVIDRHHSNTTDVQFFKLKKLRIHGVTVSCEHFSDWSPWC